MKDTTLLTPKQLAERWQMSPNTLANRRANKDKSTIPYVTLPTGAIRYRLEDIEKLEEIGYTPATWTEVHAAISESGTISDDQKRALLRELAARLNVRSSV